MIQLTDFKYGKIFVSDKDFYIGKTLLTAGEYCDEEIEIIKDFIQENDNIIEIGSNIGSLSIPISKLIPKGRLFAIEPQQYCFNILCANICINNIQNITPFKICIGDSSGIVKLPLIDYEKTNNFGGISIQPDNDGEVVEIKKLDDLFISLESLKLIKFDVEGMELSVINGSLSLLNKFRPYIYCENDRIENSKKLISKLNSLNYTCYEHKSNVFNDINYKNGLSPFDKKYIAINLLAIPNELNINNTLNKI